MIPEERKQKAIDILNSSLSSEGKISSLEAMLAEEKKLEAQALKDAQKAQNDEIKAQQKLEADKIKAEAETSTKKVEITSIEGVETITLQGKQGEKPAKEELVALITPLIPEPVPGKDGIDGKTPTKQELKRIIIPLIPEPIPGENGKDGLDGRNPQPNEVVPLVMNQLDLPEVKELILDTPTEIKNKLETLKGQDRLDASAIKNLPQSGGTFGGGGGSSGLKEIVAGTNIAVSSPNLGYQTVTLNITVSDTPPANPVLNELWIDTTV